MGKRAVREELGTPVEAIHLPDCTLVRLASRPPKRPCRASVIDAPPCHVPSTWPLWVSQLHGQAVKATLRPADALVCHTRSWGGTSRSKAGEARCGPSFAPVREFVWRISDTYMSAAVSFVPRILLISPS